MNNPSSEDSIYPIVTKDELERNICIEWSATRKKICTYWGKSKNVKISYQSLTDEVSFDAYDKKGNTIISYSAGSFDIKMDNFKFNRYGELIFKTTKSMMDSWIDLLK